MDAGGCQHEDTCDDGDACTENDTCSGGICAGTAVECSDDNLCTISESCDPAVGCVYEYVDCDDGDPCTNDTCDSDTGECEHKPVWTPDDTCDDLGCNVSIGVPDMLFVNDDDDNGNGVADCEDEGAVDGEDDLRAISLSLSGCYPLPRCDYPGREQVWEVLGFGNYRRFFRNQNRTDPLQDYQPWGPPGTVYVEGHHSHYYSGCGSAVALHLGCCFSYCYDCCGVQSAPFPVIRVDRLRWFSRSGNPGLGNCPNNGGLRIFPGKVSPTDGDAAERRKVTLVAEILPPTAGVTVYFKVWDVDDPFDQLHGPDGANDVPNVGLIDNNMAGPDNRPTGEAPRSYTADTGADGRAVVTVEVSMQPGNNYRAAASCLADALTQVDQTDADALSVRFDVGTQRYMRNGSFDDYKVPVVWSEMLTVWRKLHVETDSMVRPPFTQNTFIMPWNEPAQGPAPTQVVFDVDDPPADGAQTDHQQFTGGYVELADETGAPIVTARVVDYVTEGLPPFDGADDDEATINVPDCGEGQSGLACLGGVTSGTALFSDDDLSVEAMFTAKVWGSDDVYAGGGTALTPPDLSAMQLRYQPAYIEPVHETAASGTGGLTTFLRNVTFGEGLPLWDQVLLVRALPVSISSYWTVMVVSAFQAEEPDDNDPNAEVGDGSGLTLGICTHNEFLGDTGTTSSIGISYTGICAVFKAVLVGETGFGGREQYTVAHEVGHTFGLDHSDGGLMCPSGECQVEPFTAVSLKKLREYVSP